MAIAAKPLSGKVVLVTGGAKRLGRAAALVLAQAGADLAITYLRSEKEVQRTRQELEKNGARVLAIRCDVTDPKNVSIAVERTVAELGGLDLLINNAGAYETVPFEDLTLQQWDSIFAVNVRGPFLVSQTAQPHLRRRKGRIINLGSLGGLRAWSSHAHYCSSKAALHMLTKTMAKALGEYDRGCIQITQFTKGFEDPEKGPIEDLRSCGRLAELSNRPVLYNAVPTCAVTA